MLVRPLGINGGEACPGYRPPAPVSPTASVADSQVSNCIRTKSRFASCNSVNTVLNPLLIDAQTGWSHPATAQRAAQHRERPNFGKRQSEEQKETLKAWSQDNKRCPPHARSCMPPPASSHIEDAATLASNKKNNKDLSSEDKLDWLRKVLW
ncbi:hypothetical protein BBAD15_g6007 [Beauveria bassiana D1-5]|uniref:Uncharacterized protein n=1 Tax=Beauveria bassiana D1-5 TaxID=1245745 RepID=A0A0A2VQR2_BEABA|nr:hypothetical protein BBAD15_g6007 [Beauveria bassiana D1-5]